jgi:outer membrane lipoprotein
METMKKHCFKPVIRLWLILLIGGCATQVPPVIDRAPPDSPSIKAVLSAPADYVSRPVRWGGSIMEVDNRQDSTWVTVLALELGSHGEPQEGSGSPGRFIAVVPGFLDPAVFTEGRLLTLFGTLSGSEDRKVGEYTYRYPVMQVEEHYLWPEPSEEYDEDYPYWWYDPWYYPWPAYPYPGHHYPH